MQIWFWTGKYLARQQVEKKADPADLQIKQNKDRKTEI